MAKQKKRILVADNEENIRTVLVALLEREGYQVTPVANGQEAQQILQNRPFENRASFDAVITDLAMPIMDGMQLLHWVHQHMPTLPVVMITAFATVDTAVEALKSGAFDYVTKPFDLNEMKAVISKATKTHALIEKEFTTPIKEKSHLAIIGQNPSMKKIYELIEKVANKKSPILITGESGTGKGLIAQTIHEQSTRKHFPMIQINCAAIPTNLVESELFGYEKGAFTGAVTSKPGRFELAHQGTLFLDEIGEISLDIQVKLLRAIQSQAFERVGGVRTLNVDTRLITATNRNLEQALQKKEFREDLFYRLNVIPIQVPPLRERVDDIPLLARYFVEDFCEKMDRDQAEISSGAMALLLRYSWPGNIREMQNVLERTLVLNDTLLIRAQDLPGEIKKDQNMPSETSLPKGDLKKTIRQQGEALEKELIQKALEENDGNVTRTAKKLGISRKSLQLKMRQYGLR